MCACMCVSLHVCMCVCSVCVCVCVSVCYVCACVFPCQVLKEVQDKKLSKLQAKELVAKAFLSCVCIEWLVLLLYVCMFAFVVCVCVSVCR